MDYRTCHLSQQQRLLIAGKGILFLGAIGLLFYRSLAGVLVLCLFLPVYVRMEKKRMVNERQFALSVQFKDAINSISAALSAGFSIENAVREALRDLKRIYPADADIVRELQTIVLGYEHQISVEEGMTRFAARSGVEEIESFARMIRVGRQTGGNLMPLMQAAGRHIENKVEMKRELRILLSSRQLESRIMSSIPLLMILYLWICSPGFLDPLYGNLSGIVIMTCVLLLYVVSNVIGQRICQV